MYSVISPEGCATILWKDASKAAEAADVLKLTSFDLYNFEVVEKIIEEKEKTSEEICSDLKSFIVSELAEKKKLSVDKLLAQRYEKFRKIGRM